MSEKTLTKQEILAKRIIVFPSEGDMTDERIKHNIYKVMDEHAKQEAIAFADWVSETAYYQPSDNKFWYRHDDEPDTYLTTDQLYNLFKSKP